VKRYEKVKQIVIDECTKIFEKLYSRMIFPAELKIKMSTIPEETGIVESNTSFVIPKTINYNSAGSLVGKIKNYQISVINDGKRHFRVMIDGKEYPSLKIDFVEKQLGIPVQKKKTGPQSGYSLEPLGRAVWRNLKERYNMLDKTVQYEPSII
jgi:hypothetical protein